MDVSRQSLTERLLARGDRISVVDGRLKIDSASGKTVCDKWLAKNFREMITDIARMAREEVYFFDAFSTGRYGRLKAEGVTLQLTEATSGREVYVIFNAHLSYDRGAKKGKPYPDKRFRVGRKSNFQKFWSRLDLKQPPRPSQFHDYMGNLKYIALTGRLSSNRIDSGTLSAIHIGSSRIDSAFRPDCIQTISIQEPCISRTSWAYIRGPQTQQLSGTAVETGAGEHKCGNTVDSDTEASVQRKKPEDQTTEEWLADYEKKMSSGTKKPE